MRTEYLNKAEITGRVTSVHAVQVADRYALRLAVATNESFNRDGSLVIETTWHSIIHWTKEKSLAESITKGGRVHAEGRLRNVRYTDCDGTERNTIEILAGTLEVLPEENQPN